MINDNYEPGSFDVSATQYQVLCDELEMCNIVLPKGTKFWLVQKDYDTNGMFIIYCGYAASYLMGSVDQMWIDCAIKCKTIKEICRKDIKCADSSLS
jgi:hypothetical protein